MLEILASGDNAVYEWFLDFHAYCLQERKKSGVMLVLVGAPGTGKSTLYYPSTRNHPIFRALFGSTYMGTTGLSQLVARFNFNSGNKLFCACDEIKPGAGTVHMAELKSLADSETLDLEVHTTFLHT